MTRDDLLGLDDDALVALANRGLVKRARKEQDRGDGPDVDVDDAGTVVGTFADGTVTTLAVAVALSDAQCTCPATRVCRHRVATVMAYRATHAGVETDDAPVPRPPLAVTDEELEARIGARLIRRARRALDHGMSVVVGLGPTPEVKLPTCTVRFLVPWELAHVRCDCTEVVDCEHVALAVWALRGVPDVQADGEHRVTLGGGTEAVDDDGLDELRALQADLVRDGWAGAYPGIQPRIARIRRPLARRGAVWLLDLLDDLEEELSAYEAGASHADVDAVGALIGELGMRIFAEPTVETPRPLLHGEGASGSTQLDHTTLIGLGARVTRRGSTTRCALYFREPHARDGLVLERTYAVDEGDGPTGPEIGPRRFLKSPLWQVAAARVVTRGASRRPNRRLEMAGAVAGRTSVLPQGEGFSSMAMSVDEAHRFLAERTPASLRARVRASDVLLVRWSSVARVAWDPGRQSVWAELEGARTQAIVAAEWRAVAPGRPATLAAALDGPGVMAAEVMLRAGRLWLEPLLVTVNGLSVAPDLAPDGEVPALPREAVPDPEGPLVQALSSARSWLAAAVRTGVAHRSPTARAAGADVAKQLAGVGLTGTARAVEGLLGADDDAAVRAWRATWARVAMVAVAWARDAQVAA